MGEPPDADAVEQARAMLRAREERRRADAEARAELDRRYRRLADRARPVDAAHGRRRQGRDAT